MEWFTVAWAAVLTILLLAVVGYPLARVIGLRGYWAVGVAPAFAVTIISGTAIVAPWVGVTWSLLPVVIMTVVVGAVLVILRRVTRRGRPGAGRRERSGFDFWLLLGVLIAVTLLAARTVAIIGSPENISQTFDNIFHLNAIRYVLDTGSASPFTVGLMTSPEGSLGFYPSGWHAVVSLVVQLSGATIPAAVNGVTIAVSAVVWPLGAVLLIRALFGRSPILSVATGVLAASIPVFPILLMDYGVLYPYQFGVALLPVALAATLCVLGLVRDDVRLGPLWWGIALLGAIPGLAIVHPGAFMAWLALTVPMAVAFIARRWRAADRLRTRLIVAGGTLVYLVVGFVLVWRLRPPVEAREWPIQMNIVDAIIDVLTVSMRYQVAAVAVALAVAAGIVWVLIRRTVPGFVALGVYAVTMILYVVVAAVPNQTIRDAITGPWYNNVPRLEALLPIAMAPLAAYGVAMTWRAIASARVLRTSPRWVRSALAAVIIVFSVAITQVGPLTPVPTADSRAAAAYIMGPDSALLTADEAALIDRLGRHVPEGVTVAGNVWTGTSLAYALANRPVLMPHTLMEISAELELINDGLSQAQHGDAVCAALADLGVGFVLDFPGREVHGGEHVFPGLSDLDQSDAVQPVDREGDARLYEIVACAV